jgi:hypothetical protein
MGNLSQEDEQYKKQQLKVAQIQANIEEQKKCINELKEAAAEKQSIKLEERSKKPREVQEEEDSEDEDSPSDSDDSDSSDEDGSEGDDESDSDSSSQNRSRMKKKAIKVIKKKSVKDVGAEISKRVKNLTEFKSFKASEVHVDLYLERFERHMRAANNCHDERVYAAALYNYNIKEPHVNGVLLEFLDQGIDKATGCVIWKKVKRRFQKYYDSDNQQQKKENEFDHLRMTGDFESFYPQFLEICSKTWRLTTILLTLWQKSIRPKLPNCKNPILTKLSGNF